LIVQQHALFVYLLFGSISEITKSISPLPSRIKRSKKEEEEEEEEEQNKQETET
jgi:hypothetical protein